MSRGTEALTAAFLKARDEGRTALVAYLMGGDPTCGTAFSERARALVAGGADLIEVGIPFSDPAADGPTIQAAGVRALATGVRVQQVLDDVRSLRDGGVNIPIVAMTYANIAFVRGYDVFAHALAEAGFDGAIIPDVPLEEATPLADAMAAHGLALVLLVAPTTPPGRLEAVAKASRGFLYVVGTLGTTGARDELAPGTLSLVERVAPVAAVAGIPFALGFGVSRPEHVTALARAGAGGVVVGSALVARIGEGMAPDELARFVRSLADATHRGA